MKNINLKQLTLKCVILLSLLTAQCVQTLKHIKLTNVAFTDAGCEIYRDTLLKTSKPGNHKSPLTLKGFPVEELCVVCHLKEYICHTSSLRENEQQLFVSLHKPHAAVTADTIAQWIRCVMHTAGINTQVFGANSSRSATTSKLYSLNVPIDTILAAGGWTNAKTFAKFYNKPVLTETSDSQLLTAYSKSTGQK